MGGPALRRDCLWGFAQVLLGGTSFRKAGSPPQDPVGFPCAGRERLWAGEGSGALQLLLALSLGGRRCPLAVISIHGNQGLWGPFISKPEVRWSCRETTLSYPLEPPQGFACLPCREGCPGVISWRALYLLPCPDLLSQMGQLRTGEGGGFGHAWSQLVPVSRVNTWVHHLCPGTRSVLSRAVWAETEVTQ